MVLFGLAKGFLRMKQLFPYYPNHSDPLAMPVLKACDGSVDWDWLGYKFQMNRNELNQIFTENGILRIWK